MPSVPLLNAQRKDTQTCLNLNFDGSDTVQITIGYEFAGRDVDEELDLATIQRVGGEEPYRCNDLLGLSFETDGHEIMGSVGAGSGCYTFIVSREDWTSAIAGFRSP